MNVANIFLSHSSCDKELVEKVANELCHRGIIPWLSFNNLTHGVSLSEKLKEAISDQSAIVLFLSKDATNSAWVREELLEALRLEDNAKKNKDWIIPIYLSDPLEVVSLIPELAERWLTPDKKRVDRLGIPIQSGSILENCNQTPVERIANYIAKSLYCLLQFKEKKEINIVIDQRGSGPRYGSYSLLENIDNVNSSTLVFRPDMGNRTYDETLCGEEWLNWTRIIRESLDDALGGMIENKKIRIMGTGQLGLAYFLGNYFNRTCRAALFCRNRDNTEFTNEGQRFNGPLSGGNENCETTRESSPQDKSLPPKIKPGKKIKNIALYIGRKKYLLDVQNHIKSSADKLPLVFIETKDFNCSDQAMKLVKDTAALLSRLKQQNRVEKIRFYCGLPFNVIPLLSANLVYVADNVEFMEFRRDSINENGSAQDKYIHLPMK